MQDSIHQRRAFWHSRRGMLELDLLLVPFVEHDYALLPAAMQDDYHQLLECEDSDIYAWLMRRGSPSEVALRNIVEKIILSNMQRNASHESNSPSEH